MNTYAQYRRIVRHKQKLTDMALQFGRTDPRVVAQSRLLDRLIQPVQRREFEKWRQEA